MKNLCELDKCRIPSIMGTGDEQNGAFMINVNGKKFYVIASNGGEWDHVSVSPVKAKGCPSWKEMCAIKDMFFDRNEAVMQYHPATNKKINIVENCLHLWRPQKYAMPMPPEWMV